MMSRKEDASFTLCGKSSKVLWFLHFYRAVRRPDGGKNVSLAIKIPAFKSRGLIMLDGFAALIRMRQNLQLQTALRP